jgi:type IX secretion system PorP/SprF family membrane protein
MRRDQSGVFLSLTNSRIFNHYKLKRNVGLLLFLVNIFSGSIFAQQMNIKTGYLFDSFQINPAFAGFNDAISATSMLRKAWTGVRNSPQDAYFGLDLPISGKRAGLGFQFLDERQEVSKAYGAQLTYSYRIQVGSNSTFSMGLQTGLFDYSVNYTQLDVIDPNDPMFSQEISGNRLNFGTGFFFHSPRFYIGLASPNFIRNKRNYLISNDVTNLISQSRQVYLQTGLNIRLSDYSVFKPSVLVRAPQGMDITYDLNASLSFLNTVNFGLSYREKRAVVASVYMRLNQNFHLGYSHDLNTTRFSTIMRSVHEIMLRYEIPVGGNSQVPKTNFYY